MCSSNLGKSKRKATLSERRQKIFWIKFDLNTLLCIPGLNYFNLSCQTGHTKSIKFDIFSWDGGLCHNKLLERNKLIA